MDRKKKSMIILCLFENHRKYREQKIEESCFTFTNHAKTLRQWWPLSKANYVDATDFVHLQNKPKKKQSSQDNGNNREMLKKIADTCEPPQTKNKQKDKDKATKTKTPELTHGKERRERGG